MKKLWMSTTTLLKWLKKDDWEGFDISKEWETIELQKWYWNNIPRTGGENGIDERCSKKNHDQQRPVRKSMQRIENCDGAKLI